MKIIKNALLILLSAGIIAGCAPKKYYVDDPALKEVPSADFNVYESDQIIEETILPHGEEKELQLGEYWLTNKSLDIITKISGLLSGDMKVREEVTEETSGEETVIKRKTVVQGEHNLQEHAGDSKLVEILKKADSSPEDKIIQEKEIKHILQSMMREEAYKDTTYRYTPQAEETLLKIIGLHKGQIAIMEVMGHKILSGNYLTDNLEADINSEELLPLIKRIDKDKNFVIDSIEAKKIYERMLAEKLENVTGQVSVIPTLVEDSVAENEEVTAWAGSPNGYKVTNLSKPKMEIIGGLLRGDIKVYYNRGENKYEFIGIRDPNLESFANNPAYIELTKSIDGNPQDGIINFEEANKALYQMVTDSGKFTGVLSEDNWIEWANIPEGFFVTKAALANVKIYFAVTKGWAHYDQENKKLLIDNAQMVYELNQHPEKFKNDPDLIRIIKEMDDNKDSIIEENESRRYLESNIWG